MARPLVVSSVIARDESSGYCEIVVVPIGSGWHISVHYRALLLSFVLGVECGPTGD